MNKSYPISYNYRINEILKSKFKRKWLKTSVLSIPFLSQPFTLTLLLLFFLICNTLQNISKTSSDVNFRPKTMGGGDKL